MADLRRSAAKRRNSEVDREAENMQRSHTSLQQLVHALQYQDEERAVVVFQRLRQGADVETILRQLQTPDLLVQMHLAPETRFRNDFPYCQKMPRPLLTPSNPYLKSLVYEATGIMPDSRAPGLSSSSHPQSDHYKPQYVKPYLAAKIVDPRLDLVRPSLWTNVSADDALLRHLLGLYFLHEYHLFSCFHKDLFLDDMLSMSSQFCSELLVNAVLAQATVSLFSPFFFSSFVFNCPTIVPFSQSNPKSGPPPKDKPELRR